MSKVKESFTDPKKLTLILILLTLSFVLFFVPSNLSVYKLDAQTNHYFTNTMKKALISYGILRVIDATTSIMENSKTTEGVPGSGITIAVGEAFEPLDKIVNSFSDILFTSIVSLTVEKVIYEIGKEFTPKFIAFLLLIDVIFIVFGAFNFEKFVLGLIILVLAIRFFLPLSAIFNNYIYQHYFDKRIETQINDLKSYTSGFDKLKDFDLPKLEVNGFWDTIKSLLGFIKESLKLAWQKTKEFSVAVAQMIKNSPAMVNDLIVLSGLYLAIFIIQVILLPLISFWVLVKLFNTIFDRNIPIILKSPKFSERNSSKISENKNNIR